MGPERRIPGERPTERIQLPAEPPSPKPASLPATPGAVRAALLFGGTLLAHIVLGLTQPQSVQPETHVWAVVAFAAMCVTGLVGMYVEWAEGFRKIMLTLELLFGLTVVVLDSSYWVNQVLG